VFAHDRATAVAPFALAVILGLAAIGAGRPAPAQVVSTPAERFFRIEWQVERGDGRDAALVGYAIIVHAFEFGPRESP
jgi:hypothetical protein